MHSNYMCNRRKILSAGVSLGAAAALGTPLWAQAPHIATQIGRAAQEWLQSLSDEQRSTGLAPWSRREDWHYIPRPRPGVTLGEMTDKQRDAAWTLFGALLSARGLRQIREELKVEDILGELTGNRRFRDPGNYALVVFGDPASNEPWGWRFEGHHLSLTTIIVPGHGLSVTPAFFGANPATVPQGHKHAGFRLLGEEEDAAFGLVRSLEGEMRDMAVINDRSLGNIVAGPGREEALKAAYEGIPLQTLNEAQREGVFEIARLYAGTMRDEIASASMDRLRAFSLGEVYFAWAGSLEPGEPHYFRIHAPRTLIEYDNTQNDANHVHSVWLDPVNLFGRDLLRAHYDEAH